MLLIRAGRVFVYDDDDVSVTIFVSHPTFERHASEYNWKLIQEAAVGQGAVTV